MTSVPALVSLHPDADRVEAAVLQGLGAARLSAGAGHLSLADAVRALAGPAPLLPPSGEVVALDQALEEKTPPALAALRDAPGLVGALRELAGQCRDARLSPEELGRRSAALAEPARSRLAACADVLGRAAKRIVASGRRAPESLLELATERLDAGAPLPPRLADAGEVFVQRLHDWPPARVELVRALGARLAKSGARVRVALPLQFGGARSAVNAAGEPAFRALEALGGRDAGVQVEAQFVARAAPARLVSTATPLAEARALATEARQLLDSGAAPEAIAIACRGPAREALPDALDAAGVPWRERRGPPLEAAASVRAAFALATLAEALTDALPLGEPGRSGAGESDGPPARGGGEVSHLMNLALLAASRAVAPPLEAGAPPPEVCARLWLAAGGDPEKLRATARGEKAWPRLAAILAAARSLPDAATAAQHGAAFARAVEALGLARRARALEHPRGAAPDAPSIAAATVRALAREHRGLAALLDTTNELAQSAAALGLGEARLPRRRWLRLVRTACGERTIRPGGARGGAVRLVELSELAGLGLDHVLVGGLVDGALPRRRGVEPLLGDDEKAALARSAGRPLFRLGAETDALDLALALADARVDAVCTWHRADDAGRPAERSPLVDSLLSDAPLTTQPTSPIPPWAHCRTTADKLARAALEALGDPAWRATAPLPAAERAALWGQALAAAPHRAASVARRAGASLERTRFFAGAAAPGRFSGALSEPAAVAFVARTLREPALSASRLTELGTCRFKSFASRALGLTQPDEPSDEPTPMERGELAHDVLRGLLSRPDVLPMTEATHAAALRALDEELERAFAAAPPTGRAGAVRLRRDDLRTLLRNFVSTEWLSATGHPHLLEAEFNLDVPSPDGTDHVRLRGRIDRLDAEGARGMVIDYKSRATPFSADALFVTEWQLATYATAARHQFRVDADAKYVSTGGKHSRTLASAAPLEALTELDVARRDALRPTGAKNLADGVWRLVDDVTHGRLSPRPVSCEYCHLADVCRVQHLERDEENT